MTKIVVVENLYGPNKVYCSGPADAYDIVYYSDDDWGCQPMDVTPLHQLPELFKKPLLESGWLGDK